MAKQYKSKLLGSHSRFKLEYDGNKCDVYDAEVCNEHGSSTVVATFATWEEGLNYVSDNDVGVSDD